MSKTIGKMSIVILAAASTVLVLVLTSIPYTISQSSTFTPVALQDEGGKLWTSWFIKESLYYPTLWGISCNQLHEDCYVHMSNISTPDGSTGIEADSIGSGVYGYWFLGYSDEFVAPSNGTITVSGNFLKNDTFTHPAQEGRSHIFVFILDKDPNVILRQKEIVKSSDSASTWYHRQVSFKLEPGKVFRVGIGTENNWDTDYHVYIAWNKVNFTGQPAWKPVQ